MIVCVVAQSLGEFVQQECKKCSPRWSGEHLRLGILISRRLWGILYFSFDIITGWPSSTFLQHSTPLTQNSFTFDTNELSWRTRHRDWFGCLRIKVNFERFRSVHLYSGQQSRYLRSLLHFGLGLCQSRWSPFIHSFSESQSNMGFLICETHVKEQSDPLQTWSAMRHTMYTFSTATQRIQVSRASVERAVHGRSIIDRMLREKNVYDYSCQSVALYYRRCLILANIDQFRYKGWYPWLCWLRQWLELSMSVLKRASPFFLQMFIS